MSTRARWIFVVLLGCAGLQAYRTAVAQDANSCNTGPGKHRATAILLGSIRDVTGKPVAGTVVRGTIDKLQVMTASSDTEGRFALQIPIDGSSSELKTNKRQSGPGQGQIYSRHVELAFERNGYDAEHREVQLCPGSNPPLSVVLKPQSEFATVQGQVTGPNGSGIPHAIVSLLFSGFRQPGLITTTDEKGHYVIPHVGYGSELALNATLSGSSPVCTKSNARSLDVHNPIIEANIAFPLAPMLAWQCAPVKTGDRSSGVAEGPAAPPTIYSSPHLMHEDTTRRVTANPTLSKDTSIQWKQTTVDGIVVDEGQNIWHSGHVNDVLKISPNQLLVASDSGGVWSVATNSENAAAIPLSTTWKFSRMSSLAQGPDGNMHVYAGTYESGVLWETDTSSAAPLLNWVQEIHPFCNHIYHTLVIPESRFIIVACDQGVYWSAIPAAPAAHGTYNWLPATPGPGVSPSKLKRTFARLAKGPGWGGGATGRIVASVWGGAERLDLIFQGTWVNGQLVLQPANVAQGLIPEKIGRTTIASCPINPVAMYAIGDIPTGDSNTEDLAAVWKSSDGGLSWSMVTLPPNGAPKDGATGHQGDYNQALTVSALDCNTFALGWEYSNFVSFDGGMSYPLVLNSGTSGDHLHDDYHVLRFDPNEPQTLWIGSDGGVASASGISATGTPTFRDYNQHLADLQFYHVAPSRTDSLVAGPLQDNDVVYSVGPGAWHKVPGSSGDGADTEFTGAGSLDTLVWADKQDVWQKSPWTGAAFGSSSTVPVDGNSKGLDEETSDGTKSVSWNVRQPSYTNNAGERMYTVAGLNTDVYGLFARTDGSDMHWENIGSIGAGENVTAVSSANGTSVWAGTDQGNICNLTPPYPGRCTNFIVKQSPAAQITGVLEFSTTAGMATTASRNVLTFLGDTWNVSNGALPTDQAFTSVDGPDPQSVFVSNGRKVFVTHDFGSTWLDASQGLPTMAQANELHFQSQQDGSYIYLATFGWSIFRTQVPLSTWTPGPPCTISFACPPAGGPPQYTVQCSQSVDFYLQINSNNTFLTNGTSYTDLTDTYDDYVLACITGTQSCTGFSIFKSRSDWCSGSGSSPNCPPACPRCPPNCPPKYPQCCRSCSEGGGSCSKDTLTGGCSCV